MPRPRRIDFPGARHHVMNRGARRAPVFIDRPSLLVFLHLMGQLPERFGVAIHAYVLMPNHFHLLVESLFGHLSSALAHLQKRYADYLNARHDWDGPLFRARFHNRLVRDEAHWLHLPAYLHLNPVRGRLVTAPEEWEWSSHGCFAGLRRAPRWLSPSSLLDDFGGPSGYVGYVDGFVGGTRSAPHGFERVCFAPRSAAKAPAGSVVNRRITLSLDQALDQVAQLTRAPVEMLMRPGPGRVGNYPRALATWWMTVGAALPRKDVARHLGVSRSAVSQALARIERLCRESPVVLAHCDSLMELVAIRAGIAA